MTKWVNKGLVFEPGKYWWCQTHGMLPVAELIGGDIYRVYFGSRDDKNVSRIGWLEIDITDPKIRRMSEEPVLQPGTRGTFDDCGVCPLWLDPNGTEKKLYYMGWHQEVTTRVSEMTGLAIYNHQSMVYRSRAPVLPLTDQEPFSILVLTCITPEGEAFYDSCSGWISPQMPEYDIKSFNADGDWRRRSKHIAVKREWGDTRVSCARVIKNEMYFCYAQRRGYKLGYAVRTVNGWERQPLRIPKQEWDKGMQCYPFPVYHKGRRYLLYSGSDYGRTGFGLAEET